MTDPSSPTATAVRAHEPPPLRLAQAVRDEAAPLTADLSRLHVTVSSRFLEKLARARDGLSHALPRASAEQVLEAALDSLLERQARRKALVMRPRAARARSTSGASAGGPFSHPPPLATRSLSNETKGPKLPPSASPGSSSPLAAPRRSRAVPAAIEREVRRRDGERCQFLLDVGAVCGSSWQVELDHVVPFALGGPATAANLRCVCRVHNQRLAELELGAAALACRPRRGPR